MQLHSVYARFYRSLNYDFVRASGEKYVADPWDATPMGNYPFVRVKLRPGITTVVGANESGKSQVLRAIEAALTGKGFDRSDFCRYSRFFGVDGTVTLPEFGAVYSEISLADLKEIEAMSSLRNLSDIDRVGIFRMNDTPVLRVYVRSVGGAWSEGVHIKSSTSLAKLGAPVPFRIDADVPLPDSVPIQYLATGKVAAGVGRRSLRAFWDRLNQNRDWFGSEASVASNAAAIVGIFQSSSDVSPDEIKQYELAADLLVKVGGVKRSLFQELQDAVRTKNGYANSIVDTINALLARALDFPHWWSQDSQFELFVSLYEFDLVFMIRDRTGRSYGFDERSDGMKYFLSYFVQYLAHEPRGDGQAEILLMDEPDRFLSSSGQQDLLRIFEDFAQPKDAGRQPVQVVYVTHSPFLIDKNEADRIRVLEKGEFDEGTRVVSNASANHYEPLRSAFGSFVAETAFIGNCNLMVEGTSDQVLIAGASRWLKTLKAADRDILNLNSLTIVPAGGTRHIPYLVYLARGRDVEKPPVVVLLDSDKAGDEAREDIAAGGAYGDKLLDPGLVLQLGIAPLDGMESSNPQGISGIEDLIPLRIAIDAAQLYCGEFVPGVDVAAMSLDDASVFTAQTEDNGTREGTLKLLQRVIAARSGLPRFHLDKVAFARAVVDVMTRRDARISMTDEDVAKVEKNFRILLAEIARCQRQAERAESVDRISSRINRAKRAFTRTHHDQARREDVSDLIEEITNQLDNSPEAEDVRAAMRSWRRDFDLDADPRALVDDYPRLLRAVDSLAYQALRASSS